MDIIDIDLEVIGDYDGILITDVDHNNDNDVDEVDNKDSIDEVDDVDSTITDTEET